MSLGAFIRGALGPLEPLATRAYRAAFFDVPSLATTVSGWTKASRILEVGCGEGALANHVLGHYPRAHYVGIDVTPRVGRLFTGDRARAEFHEQQVQTLVAAAPRSFDLVLICDVLHHVPLSQRHALLEAATAALSPGGVLILKEWEHRPTLIHLAAWASDNLLSASPAWFWTSQQLKEALTHAAPSLRLEREVRLAPWANNLVLMARNSAESDIRP